MDKGEIRDIARSVLDRKRSASTERQYRRAFAMLDGADWREYAEAFGYSRRSGYRLKAAFQFGAAEKALEWLKESDRANRANNKERAKEARAEAARLAEKIQAEADYERCNQHRQGHQAAYKGNHPGRGKRKSLRGLSEGWQRHVVHQAEKRDKLAIWAMALSGARPAEVAKGIKMEATPSGIRFHIKGAKTQQGFGQEWRAFTATGPEAEALAHALQKRGKRTLTAEIPWEGKDPLGNFRKRVKKAAKRAGFSNVSAYSMRHAVASGMKAAGVPAEVCAGALGHSVDATVQMYGHAYQGAGGIGVENLETAQEVRQTANQPLPDRQAAPEPEPDNGPGKSPGR